MRACNKFKLCRPQEVIKKLERGVIRMVEESAQAAAIGDLQTVSITHTHTHYTHHTHSQAVDKAKESARRERMLCKQRQQSQMTETINLDLTYFVRPFITPYTECVFMMFVHVGVVQPGMSISSHQELF